MRLQGHSRIRQRLRARRRCLPVWYDFDVSVLLVYLLGRRVWKIRDSFKDQDRACIQKSNDTTAAADSLEDAEGESYHMLHLFQSSQSLPKSSHPLALIERFTQSSLNFSIVHFSKILLSFLLNRLCFLNILAFESL